MSSVRACDFPAHAGGRDIMFRLFSENEEGWSTATGTRRVRNPITGRMDTETYTMDICPSCSGVMDDVEDTPRSVTSGKVIREE